MLESREYLLHALPDGGNFTVVVVADATGTCIQSLLISCIGLTRIALQYLNRATHHERLQISWRHDPLAEHSCLAAEDSCYSILQRYVQTPDA